jgi:hypothetical protein
LIAGTSDEYKRNKNYDKFFHGVLLITQSIKLQIQIDRSILQATN